MTGSTDSGFIAARIYGMRSRLLSHKDYESLLDATSLDSLITSFRGMESYKAPIETHLLLEDPLRAIDDSINDVLSAKMKKILGFCGGSYEQAFKVLGLRWEVSNIHLAVRSVIEETEFPINFIPLGTLERDELEFLTSFTNLPEVLAYLESTLNPFALPLRQIVDENIAPTNLNAIDGVFNRFYQSLLTRGIAKIPDGEIRSIMTQMVREEREFQNITSILNLMGKLARGTLPSTVDLKGVIFSGKSHIQPDEVEDLIRNKDLGGLREILARSSFRERLATSAVDVVATTGIQALVEEIEHLFYLNQIRKRYRRHVFNLALGYFWQMSVEARNLRIITHGIESFSREEIRRRIINA